MTYCCSFGYLLRHRTCQRYGCPITIRCLIFIESQYKIAYIMEYLSGKLFCPTNIPENSTMTDFGRLRWALGVGTINVISLMNGKSSPFRPRGHGGLMVVFTVLTRAFICHSPGSVIGIHPSVNTTMGKLNGINVIHYSLFPLKIRPELRFCWPIESPELTGSLIRIYLDNLG